MIAVVDVDYRDPAAVAAAVLARRFDDDRASAEHTARIAQIAPYEPGRFYLRELPCLRAVLSGLSFELVVVDGYVWLDGGRPGLGAHVHEAFGVPVVGVAKTEFTGAAPVQPVLRGTSSRPLFVSAVGLALHDAAERVRTMHGPHRIPTLLSRVDRLCRSG
jgi:deoxyribonuclease V